MKQVQEQGQPMMVGKAQEMANTRYKDLCAEIGDCEFQMSVLAKRRATAIEAASKLNEEVPFMIQVEQSTIATVMERQAVAQKEQAQTVAKAVENMKREQPKNTPSGN